MDKKGIEKGIEKGKQLSKHKLEIVIILKNILRFPNMTHSQISEYEEVPLELVEKLNSSFKNGDLIKAKKVVFEQFKKFGKLGTDDVAEIEAIVTYIH